MARYLFALSTPRRTSGNATRRASHYIFSPRKWDILVRGTLLFAILRASADAYKMGIINATPRDNGHTNPRLSRCLCS